MSRSPYAANQFIESRHSTPTLCKYALTVLVIALSGLPLPGSATDRPNILFVVTDDVGIGDIRSYNPDGKVSLPTIESIARGGIRFNDAHVSASKCAPSRYSIITGNYHWRGRKGWGQWNFKGGSQILEEQETLGTLLRRAGYRTAFVGKYHLGADFYRKNSDEFVREGEGETRVDFARPMVNGPADRGFESSLVALRGIQDSPYAYFRDDRLVGSADDLIRWEVGDYGNTEIVKSGIGLPDWVTRDVGPILLEYGVDFIETHHRMSMSGQTASPFFLYFNTQAAHGPHKPPVAIGEDRIRGESGLTTRTDMLIEIDVILDRLLDALDQRDMLEDTLIIFTSDNGGLRIGSEERAGHRVSAGFRGDKGTIYEGGHRVPLIIKWGSSAFDASSLPPGSALEGLVGVQDLYATIADLVGLTLGENEALDSMSILPMLRGRQTTSPRSRMVFEANEPEDNAADGGLSGNHFAFRSGDFKLVLNSSKVAVGLYDLAIDPAESTNLVNRSTHRDRATSMRAAFIDDLNSARTSRAPAPNTAPTVEILDPPGGAIYSYIEAIVLSARATDSEDGELSDALTWTSSIDGELGRGSRLTTSSLSLGEHSITAEISDSRGATAASTIELTVENRTPTLIIDGPGDEATFDDESTIVFEGTAADFEDGDLSNAIAWASSRDGEFGTGGSVSASGLSIGEHVITATVEDTLADGVATTIRLSVTEKVTPPSTPAPPVRPTVSGGSGGGMTGLADLLVLISILLLMRRLERTGRS